MSKLRADTIRIRARRGERERGCRVSSLGKRRAADSGNLLPCVTHEQVLEEPHKSSRTTGSHAVTLCHPGRHSAFRNEDCRMNASPLLAKATIAIGSRDSGPQRKAPR